MTGADRFQLLLDRSGRENYGTGNCIKTHICIEGIIPEAEIRLRIGTNKAVNFLAVVFPFKKWYSTKINWNENNISDLSKLITFYQSENAGIILAQLLQQDCDFTMNSQLRFDIIYESGTKTHLLISVNHALLDFSGMELLLKSIATDEYDLILKCNSDTAQPFLKSFIKTIQATFFVAARSGWNIQGLKKSTKIPLKAYETMLISDKEWPIENKTRNLKGMPLYLASSILALSQQKRSFKNKSLPLFIPSPINRRTASLKNVLLSNHLSYLFFRINEDQLTTGENIRKIILQQLIHQAKRKMPDKFQSLLTVFSYLPNAVYKAFIDLPSNGQSSTFAFSTLPESVLESGIFMNFKVSDFTHYPPFLSPPGLNIVFMEKNSGIKIIVSFDQNRISREDVTLMLGDIKNNLTGN